MLDNTLIYRRIYYEIPNYLESASDEFRRTKSPPAG
jgi:hypothetical protein